MFYAVVGALFLTLLVIPLALEFRKGIKHGLKTVGTLFITTTIVVVFMLIVKYVPDSAVYILITAFTLPAFVALRQNKQLKQQVDDLERRLSQLEKRNP